MSEIDAKLDGCILSQYQSTPLTVDELLTDPSEALAFAEAVRGRLRPSDVDTPVVLRRLIALRKMGEERGGLPRKRRPR